MTELETMQAIEIRTLREEIRLLGARIDSLIEAGGAVVRERDELRLKLSALLAEQAGTEDPEDT